jgi:hypothetical protein
MAETQKTIDLKNEIRSRYGCVRRAYDYHLYTEKGVRLLDFCQEGGSAILGWRSGKSKLALKNVLDRGITGTFPSEAEGELVRAVQEILPQYSSVRWYASKERAASACASYLGLWSDIPLIESPLLHPEASIDIGPSGDSPLSSAKQVHGIPIWRPWLDEAFYGMSDRVDSAFLNNVNDTLETMVLSSPLPFAGGFTIAVFSGSEGETSPIHPDSGTIRPSDSIAPALLAAYARAFADLASALYERTESDWAKFDKFLDRWWDRRGPYLVPKIRRSRYPEFFAACLDKGILVSPDYDTPSIVPYVADPGEFKPFTSGLLP